MIGESMIHGSSGLNLTIKAVTKSDTADNAFGGFFVTGTGDVTFKDLGDNSVTLTAVPAYTLCPFGTTKIMSTGTTATGIFGVR